jgi:hypothetical protein
MVHFTKLFIIAAIVITPALAVPLPLEDDVGLVIREPFKKWFRRLSPKKIWNGVKKGINTFRKIAHAVGPILSKAPGAMGAAGRMASMVPRELEEGLFARALEEELAARGFDVQFESREYDDALEARDDGTVDLEAREFINALAREYVDTLEARDYDDELAARDFFSNLDVRGLELEARDLVDELEVREPEFDSSENYLRELSYDELD